jgi:uncharacterized protein (UPF0261 family)
MKTIAIAGTFDSKGKEFLFLKHALEEFGLQTLMIHTGVFEPAFEPDVSNREVAAAVGEDIDAIAEKKDRAWATEVLSKGMAELLPKLYEQGMFDGVISLGGSGGTSLVTPAMQKIPIGVPKIMVSTVAVGNTEQYVGTSDILMMPSIVDVAGLNSISTKIFTNAAAAMAGMLTFESEREVEKKPLIAATMFGVTTPCVEFARAYLEKEGYEVLTFHATGVGGRAMEALVDAGYIEGVLDITTTEWCDEIVGGVLAAGPNRLEAAGKKGIPQVVSVGALDMVNYGAIDTVPEEHKNRILYKHNPMVTLMRTSVEENQKIGKKIVEKLNMANGPTALMLPLKGVSMIDAEGQPFHGAHEDAVLFDVLRNGIDQDVVELIEMPNHINDQVFAEAAAQRLLDLLRENK